MSRHYYNNGGEHLDIFRNQNRSLPLASSQTSRATSRVCPISQRSTRDNRASPCQETEQSGNSQRRRIAVACSRCRKRKIKCSGDPGNGQGCQNCKNSGTDPNQCQFLRVNSEPFNPLLSPEWPYSDSGAASISYSIPQVSVYGHYPPINAVSFPSHGSVSYPGTSALTRSQLSNSFSSIPYSPATTRQEFSTNYNVGSADALFGSYTIQNPQYLLQDPEPQISSTLYGAQDTIRQWSGIGQSSHSSVCFENDGSGRYSSIGVSYGGSLGSSTLSAIDVSPMFPTMGSLANSLPLPLSSSDRGDRVLPDPRTGAASAMDNTLGSSSVNFGDTSFITSHGGEVKSDVSWGSESTTTGGNQSSTTTAHLPIRVAMGGPTGKSSLASISQGQGEAFSYIQIPRSPHGSSTTAPMDRPNPKGDMSASDVETRNTTAPRESLSRAHLPSSNTHSYSFSRRESQPTTSEGTLLNGQPYTSLQPSQPQIVVQHEGRRRQSSDANARTTHKSSIAGAGTSRR